MNYYLVGVNTPFNHSLLTYKSMLDEIPRGTLVKVPLGKRMADGCILKKVSNEEGI